MNRKRYKKTISKRRSSFYLAYGSSQALLSREPVTFWLATEFRGGERNVLGVRVPRRD